MKVSQPSAPRTRTDGSAGKQRDRDKLKLHRPCSLRRLCGAHSVGRPGLPVPPMVVMSCRAKMTIELSG